MATRYVRVEAGENAERLSKQLRDWIAASVRPRVGWPAKDTLVEFAGQELLLLPERDGLFPAVATQRRQQQSERDVSDLINRFLSAFAWERGAGIEVVAWTSGTKPPRFGRTTASVTAEPFRLVHLPVVVERNQRLALAFFREAASLDHPGYAFLSYYKIINLRFPTGDQQRAWIRSATPRLTDIEAKKRLRELKEADVANYLYKSCRCAVAHAGGDPTVDPEDFDDQQRLRRDLPLIRALATHGIETEFGVPTLASIQREHAHEVEGFRQLLGVYREEALLAGEPVSDLPDALPTRVSIRLWGTRTFLPLEGMSVEDAEQTGGAVHFSCLSQGRTIRLNVALDFPRKRLLFNPDDGTGTSDDGSVAALEDAAELQDFLGRYWSNGSLEVWDADSAACLGWCMPFIPKNIDLLRTVASYREAARQLRTEAMARRLR